MTSGTRKRLIAVIVSFDLAFSPLAAFAHDKKDGSGNGSDQEITDTSEAQRMLAPIVQKAAELNQGKEQEITSEALDLWALAGQFVELFDGTKPPDVAQEPTSSYPLDRSSLKRERPDATKLTAKIDPNDGHLIIEATRGENDKGEHGMLVARMHVSRMKNIVALAEDAEVLSMIDTAGRLSVLDWGWVEATRLTAPVQVEKNLWQPLKPIDVRLGEVEASYITRGTRTLDVSNLYSEDVTFAADPDGQPMHTPGDLVVKVKGKIFALLDRSNSHKAIQLNQAVLYGLRQWIEDDPREMENLAEGLKFADREIVGFADELRRVEDLAVDPLTRKVIIAIGSDVLDPLHKRIQAHSAYLKRNTGSMTAADHDAFFRDVERNAIAEEKADDAYMQANWPELVTRRYQTRAQQNGVVNESKWMQRKRSGKYIAKMASLAGALVALMASPQLYEHSEFLQRFWVFSWTYQHVPAVLKDAGYRWPLIYHTLAMTAIWPVAPAISGLLGYSFKAINVAVQNVEGPVGGRVRDFTKTWSEMEAWKRIVATGLRAYSFLVLSPVVTIVEKLMQQRALLKAGSLAINPAEVITPESEIGMKVGLDEAMTVGFNKMSVRGLISVLTLGVVKESKSARVAAAKTQETKMRVMAEIYQRNKDRRNYNKILATMVVAAKRKIPEAVLVRAMQNKEFSLSHLRRLIEDPKDRQLLELLEDDLNRRKVELPFIMRDQRFGFNPAEYADQFEAANKAVDDLEKMDGVTRYLRELRITSRARALAAWSYVLNQGRGPAQTLYNILPNEEAWSSTQREFILDHLWMIFMPAMLGDRANFAIPDQLAADANGILWTRGVALQDLAQNTSAHFFTSGARFVLQHMLIEAVAERRYEPIDKVINRVLYRDAEGHKKEGPPAYKLAEGGRAPFDPYLEQQNFWPGVAQFVKSLNPAVSDIGGEARRGIKNNFDLIFGYAWFGMAFRVGLGHQNVGSAAIGLSELWLLTPLFIWTWWWVLQKGYVMYKRFFEAKQDKFQAAQSDLAQANRERDPARRETMQKDGIWNLYLMYDEGAPEKINREFHPLTTRASLQDQAAYWADLASHTSPGAMTPNTWIPWLQVGVAAAGSTYTGIWPLVWSTMPQYQTLYHLGLAALTWAVFVPVFTFAFSKDTWTTNWKVKFKEVSSVIRDSYRKRCQADLTPN